MSVMMQRYCLDNPGKILTWPGYHHFENGKPVLAPAFLLPLSSSTQLVNPNRIDVPQECPVLHENDASGNDEAV